MITMKELLGNAKLEEQTSEVKSNLGILLSRINLIRTWWGKPMIVTSGLRTLADHLRIYASKGVTDTSKIPMKSRHLIGAAVDIADNGLFLTKWLKEHEQYLVDAKLWCESNTPTWVHFQILPPTSGKRWFLP